MSVYFRSFLLVSFLLTFAGEALHAQAPVSRKFTMKDGLPGAVVYHCTQDRQGFIWFATNQGVSRFDGRTFRNFSKVDGLPDNDILKLFVDLHGAVWFITLSGVPAVYWNGTITSLDCQGVYSIAEDLMTDSIHLPAFYMKDNVSYCGNYISKSDPGHWQFSGRFKKAEVFQDMFNKPFLRASGEGVNYYYTVLNDKTSLVSLRTRRTTRDWAFDNEGDAFLAAYTAVSFQSVLKGARSAVFHNGKSLFYADFNGIQRLLSFKDLGLNIDRENDVNYLLCENDSTMWMCTRNKGLIRIDHFRQPDRQVRYYLPNSYCTSLLKDKEGGYWVTTASEGVFYLPNLDFYSLASDKSVGESDIKCIKVVGPHSLAAGFTDGNIVLIDPATYVTRPLLAWAERNKFNRVLDIKPLHKDLVVTTDGGVFRLMPDQFVERAWKLGGFKETLIESDSVVLMAGASGVMRYRWGSPVISHPYKGRATSIAGTGDRYYFSTLQGVYLSDHGVMSRMGAGDSLLSGIVNQVAVGPDSVLWAATQQGVVVYRKGRSRSISMRDGLLSNNCRHVFLEGSTAWVSTDKGIAKITYQWLKDSLDFSLLSITENDGLVSDAVSQVAAADDHIWAATARGISYFPKSYRGTSFFSPTIVIDRVLADNVSIPVEDSLLLKQQKNLTVEFASIAFRHGSNVYYQYRLDGADDQWFPLINNKISLSALPYGEYALQVAAFSKQTNVAVASKSLFIAHQPPFWKQGWFIMLSYLLSVSIVGFLIYLFYRRRQQKKEELYQVNKKLYDLEIMALRAQMNPHFIFNCLNSIQHYILTADVENANLYLHRFSLLIRKTLQMSSSALVPLEDEIGMLELYLELEQMRLGERMCYEILVGPGVRKQDFFVPSMILQPYVENAIKHGISPLRNRMGTVSVQFSMKGDCLECLIVDDGVGLHASQSMKAKAGYRHLSMGHRVTEGRIQLINSIRKNKIILQVTDRRDHATPADGTEVQIIFPAENE
ncbi:histidine kinase [Paraflavitalea sp. CAU 1676]|uniref:sensor histidine kinase n=1 Tax=Paraflavitalea sp. CAU 1676 TaxID=3032598 RepID=UPI0023DA8EE9|nr:histidine kinase [Paraflavitalea sp. CAU 1676]MDF2190419.1 histidine kinase [Paraflavitalea sp. CAU 1676]